MHQVFGVLVEPQVLKVHLVVQHTVRRVGLDDSSRLHPGVDVAGLQQARRPARQERIAIRSADGDLRNNLRHVGDVGDDLQPGVRLGTAAHCHDAVDPRTNLCKSLEVVAHPESDPFQRGLEQVLAGVRQRQPGDDASGLGIVDRCPLTTEIGQHQAPAGTAAAAANKEA